MKKEKISPKQQFLLDFCNKVYGLKKRTILYRSCRTNPVLVDDQLFYMYVYADRSSTAKKTYVKFKDGNKTYLRRSSKEAGNLIKKAEHFIASYKPGLQAEVRLVTARQVVHTSPRTDPVCYLELVCPDTYPWQ